jgi:hypothetical protein
MPMRWRIRNLFLWVKYSPGVKGFITAIIWFAYIKTFLYYRPQIRVFYDALFLALLTFLFWFNLIYGWDWDDDNDSGDNGNDGDPVAPPPDPENRKRLVDQIIFESQRRARDLKKKNPSLV